MTDCLFCKIVNKEIPAKIVFENDEVIAFEDINPRAPYHILIIPRKHIATLNDLEEQDMITAGHLLHTAQLIAKDLGIAEDGYRIVMNCNKAAGQVVFHIHLHLLGGRQLHWPPG